MEHRITLSVVDGQWIATTTGGDEVTIRQLFGTNALPTPFSAGFPAAGVQARIRKLNPAARIVIKLADSGRTV